MEQYITRVELHSATGEDYDALHTHMQAADFTQTIWSKQNIEHHLPPAEYNRIADLTTQQVLTSAQNAAAKTGKGYSV